MFFHLKVSSKNKKALDNFSTFLSKIETSPIFLKHFPKQKTRKFITILKSPHVNKTAQEQFEFRFYTKQFLIKSFIKPLTFLLFFKKIKNFSFPGINLEIKGLFEKRNKSKTLLKLINPDNVTLYPSSNPSTIKQNLNKFNPTSAKKYIQLFDCYGEIYLNNYLKNK